MLKKPPDYHQMLYDVRVSYFHLKFQKNPMDLYLRSLKPFLCIFYHYKPRILFCFFNLPKEGYTRLRRNFLTPPLRPFKNEPSFFIFIKINWLNIYLNNKFGMEVIKHNLNYI